MGIHVFSDESGLWNSGDHYVRSWIKVESEDYLQLKKEVVFAKHNTRVNELKYDKFSRNLREFESIFSVPFDIFITISVPEHFDSKSYTILQTLRDIPVSQSTGGDDLTDAIKEKIISSARNTLFFAYFERYHIMNSMRSLVENVDPQDFEYMVDSPQCLRKEWESIARECGIQNVKVVKRSYDCPGIELADVVAGCVSKKIQGDATACSIYETHIKNKMTDMTSRACPNPNLIFHGEFTDEQKDRLQIFR